MRIKSFEVRDFRSIKRARVPLQDLTCLVGANNEGKSNILHAVVAAASRILGYEGTSTPLTGRRDRSYDFAFIRRRDLPRGYGDAQPSVELTLELSDPENDAFFAEFAHNIEGELTFGVDFLDKELSGVTILDQEPCLISKTSQIATFVRERLRLAYIPAIRTGEHAVGIVRSLLNDQLRTLRRNPEYVRVLTTIEELEEPLLRSMEEKLQQSLNSFLVDVSSITIKRRGPLRTGPIGSFIDVAMDDGVATDISEKGEGIQSLAAIALARQRAQADDSEQHIILVIEEPESHLHPLAIRHLHSVLREISQEQQVIMTTHSPLLIDPLSIPSSVIVRNQDARPANDISEIRDCLGVAVSDNLVSTRLVVLVEGPGDVKILTSLLSETSDILRTALLDGVVRLEALNGADNLNARASALRSITCSFFAFLDGDGKGQSAVKRASWITTEEYMLIIRTEASSSEMEDLFTLSVYKADLEDRFNITIDEDLGIGKRKKWKQRFIDTLRRNGHVGTTEEVNRAKDVINGIVCNTGRQALNSRGTELIDLLANRLTAHLV